MASRKEGVTVFKLSIPVNISNIDGLKASLSTALGVVKSSHRCEGLARGLGFRSYASLLASAKFGETKIATTDGQAFQNYLRQHNFDIAPSHLYNAVATTALSDVARGHPTLTCDGFGIGDWMPGDTASKRRNKFNHSRAELVSKHAAAGFLASLTFIMRVEPTKTVRPKTNSYWLKHIAENFSCTYPEGEELGPIYVSNGIFIAAAIHAGFKVKPYKDDYGRELLNASFNMAHARLYELDCEIRPNGARAQDRGRREEERHLLRQGFCPIV